MTTTTNTTHGTPKNTLRGGDTVPAGFYWNRKNWEIAVLSGDGGTLPNVDGTFVKVPMLAMVVLAPVMGGLYVMFLPFIGIALLANFLARKAASGVEGMAHDLASTVGPEWRPGEAWFTGRPKKGTKKGQPAEPKADEPEKNEEPKQD